MSSSVTSSGKTLKSTANQTIRGKCIVSKQPISWLGFVNPETGRILDKEHSLYNISISNKIFVFPKAVGSTVGPYVLINLRKYKKLPLAIINQESDQGTIAGCSLTKTPLIYNLDASPNQMLKTDSELKIEIFNGKATIYLY